MRIKSKAFLLLFVITLMLSGCKEESNNSIIKSIESPDEKYVACLFTRDLGATTKISYQLSILKNGEKLSNNKGNIFISYDAFDMEWNKADELTVKRNEGIDIFKQETEYSGIKINYKP